MLGFSESPSSVLQRDSIQNEMENLAHALAEFFPERLSTVEEARSYIARARGNLRNFPSLADTELPYWVFLSILVNDENYFTQQEIKKWFESQGTHQVRLLYDTLTSLMGW